jgi:hypothetical protein
MNRKTTRSFTNGLKPNPKRAKELGYPNIEKDDMPDDK